MDIETVRVTALEAIFDLLLVFGFETFNVSTDIEAKPDDNNDDDVLPSDVDKSNTSGNIISMLVQLLDTEVGFCIRSIA